MAMTARLVDGALMYDCPYSRMSYIGSPEHHPCTIHGKQPHPALHDERGWDHGK